MVTALHPYAAYWDKGVRNVPDMTGAKHLLDGHDLQEVFWSLGITAILPNVLDVGCGTGRLAQLSNGCYRGVDISPSMVEYCVKQGLYVSLIASSGDLPTGPFEWVTSISVFTHIDRAERKAYLRQFEALAPNVLVDIIPGDGTGNVALWSAVPDHFEEDIVAAGFEIVGVADHQWDMHTHRYYRLRRAD
jgi:SAM-dependent methyltransferase